MWAGRQIQRNTGSCIRWACRKFIVPFFISRGACPDAHLESISATAYTSFFVQSPKSTAWGDFRRALSELQCHKPIIAIQRSTRDLRIVFSFESNLESNRPYTTQAVTQPNGLQAIGILYL